MKVGHIIGGLEVVDVKLVNKLNLIQFLKEVDSYLQKGYQIDVASGRQIGLVLQVYVYKTEDAFGGVGSTDVGSVGDQVPTESAASLEADSVSEDTPVPEESVVTESTVQQEQVNDEPVEAVVKEEAPVAPKKTTTRSKKTAQ